MALRKRNSQQKLEKENRSFKTLVFSIFGHFGSAALIFLSSLPFMRWFYLKDPALGVDFHLMATYVNYFQHHLAWPWSGWKNIWFGGVPLFDDYPALHFYAAIPWANIFGVFRGIQLYLFFTLFLFLFFCYLLFWEISKSKVLSIILTSSITWSSIIYGSLVFGGNGSSFANLFFVPLTLYLIVKYYHSSSIKYLLVAGLAAGFSFIGHSGIALYYLVPLSFLLIFLWLDEKTKFLSWKKIKDLIIFAVVMVLVAGGVIYHYIVYYTQTSGLSTYGNFKNWMERVKFMTNMTLDRVHEIDWLLLFGAALSVLLLIIFAIVKKQPRKIKFVLPFLFILIYLILFVYLPQQWGGTWRMFWAFPLALGLIVSAGFIQIKKMLNFGNFWQKNRGKIVVGFISILILGGAAIYFWLVSNKLFYHFDREDLIDQYGQPVLNSRLIGSYPGLVKYPLSSQEIRNRVLPPWIKADDTEHRFYAMDATYNLWFNAYFEMPLVRGYVPAITSKLDNWLYWSDTSLTKDDIVALHNVPVSFAKKYALFNIDWLAIKYLEGTKPEDYNFTEVKKAAGANPEDYYLKKPRFTRQYYAPVSTYLQGSDVIKQKEWWEDCLYYEVQDNLTSPIIKATNAPAVLVIGNDEGYDVILKNIALNDYNSQYLIPVHVNQIDSLSQAELNEYEAVILYNYQYKDSVKAFALIDEYVKQGGKLYIETGSISPQETASQLPDFFPVYATTKKGISQDWQFEEINDPLIQGVDFNKFSEAAFQAGTWGVSYSPENRVKDWAKTVLKIHGNPALVYGNYGQGEVIWSGFNFPYHILAYNNENEVPLFGNIIRSLVSIKKDETNNYSVSRPKSEKVVVSSQKATGVLFKESAYPGWYAKVKSENKNQSLKIRPAGLDFMYVRIPEEYQQNFEMRINYHGTVLTWFFYVLAGLTILFVLDYIILKRRIFDFITFNLFTKKEKRGLVKKIGGWWDRDEI